MSLGLGIRLGLRSRGGGGSGATSPDVTATGGLVLPAPTVDAVATLTVPSVTATAAIDLPAPTVDAVAAVASGFNPLTDIPGLTGYFDADGLTVGALATWTNQGSAGSGSDLVQATGANKPTVTASSINGHNSVDFNGTTSFMATAAAISSVVTSTALTSWSLVCVTASTGTNAIGASAYVNPPIWSDANGYLFLNVRSTGDLIMGEFSGSAEKGATIAAGISIGTSTWYVIETKHSAGQMLAGINAAAGGAQTAGATDLVSGTLRLGIPNGAAKFLGMKIQKQAFSNQVVSTLISTSMRNYLYSIAGISGS